MRALGLGMSQEGERHQLQKEPKMKQNTDRNRKNPTIGFDTMQQDELLNVLLVPRYLCISLFIYIYICMWYLQGLCGNFGFFRVKQPKQLVLQCFEAASKV